MGASLLQSLAELMTRHAAPGLLAEKPRLNLPAVPTPFVLPPIAVEREGDLSESSLAVEVILISSPAAVGKSTAARYLSATANAPLLDLSETKVSTHALAGLFGPELAKDDADEFHAGRLPLIIDALDEGQINSGEPNLEEFLTTTWQYLLTDRSVIDRPKLVLLGRDEVMNDLVKVSLNVDGGDLSFTRLYLDFFDLESAVRLVQLQGAAEAAKHDRTWEMGKADHEALDALFDAIEAALKLETGSLWKDPAGRAFTGYAPVLITIGEILAVETSNAIELRNLLRDTAGGTTEAWGVLQRVIDFILDRERTEKLLKALEGQLQSDPPSEAYDRKRQLSYVVQYSSGKELNFADVPMVGSDAGAYREAVRTFLPGHPFLKDRDFANEVLAGFALANGVIDGLIDVASDKLRDASRQPFLWRSLRSAVSEHELVIDGRYLGCVLNSMWSEIGACTVPVTMTAIDEIEASVAIGLPSSEDFVSFNVLDAIEFYGQLRDASVDVASPVEWHGDLGSSVLPSFRLKGEVTVLCDELTIATPTISIDGSVRLRANALQQPANLDLTGNFESLWLGGEFEGRYPWYDHPSTLAAPASEQPEFFGVLDELLWECSRRMHTSPTLEADLTLTDDHRMDWARKLGAERFTKLVRLMRDHGLASTRQRQASGPRQKVILKIDVGWDDLRDDLRRLESGELPSEKETPPDQARRIAFLRQAREAIP